MSIQESIYICPENPRRYSDLSRAQLIAREYGLPLCLDNSSTTYRNLKFWLKVSRDKVYLKPVKEMISFLGSRPVFPDWLSTDVFSPAGRKASQPLIRAIQGSKKGIKKGLILDCTAGLGKDSWILAAFGFSLIAIERSPVVYILLRDARARAGIEYPKTSSKIKLLHKDTLNVLLSLESTRKGLNNSPSTLAISGLYIPRPDIIYLDPVFPDYKKRKTAEKKEAKTLRTLEMQSSERESREEELLSLSLREAKKKVVIKRPQKGPLYANGVLTPVHCVYGKGVRFDIYTANKDFKPNNLSTGQ